MKKNFLFGVLAVSMLVACSQDEVTSFSQDEISYGVMAGKQSRAADSYCNNDLPGSFKVYAGLAEGNSLYINGDEIVKTESGSTVTWINKVGTRYWPEVALNFFAHVNGDGFFAYNNGTPEFSNFTVKNVVGEQVDLLYAEKLDQEKSDGTVPLNFRHALSQIVFQAKNTNPHLYVEVSGVSVGHIGNQATFTYPTSDTDGNYEGHNDEADEETLSGLGSWSNAQESTFKQYDVAFEAVPLASTVTNLTLPDVDHVNGFANAMMLIPQTATAWDPTTPGMSATDWNGAYFLIKCKICNIAGTEYNAATDIVLHDGNAAIPVGIDWEQGKRYIYTFTFSNGDGGYLPDPSNPQPVLTSIKFDVTVDDFVPVDGGDKPMDTGNDNGSVSTGDYNGTTW